MEQGSTVSTCFHLVEGRFQGKSDHSEATPSPLAVISLVDKAGRRRDPRSSHEAKKTLTPNWNARFLFDPRDDCMGFELTVVDYETDEQLGQATIPASLCTTTAPLDEWISLAPPHTATQTPIWQSQIHIRVILVSTEERHAIEIEEKAKEESRRRSREMQKMFNIDEEYLKEYSCALERKILHQGHLYITANHVLFGSHFTKKVIRLDEIKAIEKRKSIGIINNALAIITKDGQEYLFKSFRKRDACIDSLEKQLRIVSPAFSVDGGSSSDEETKSGSSAAGVPSPEAQPANGTIPSGKKKRALSRNVSLSKDDTKPPSPPTKSVTIRESPDVAGPLGDPALAPIPMPAGDDSPSDEDVTFKVEREISAKLKSRLLTGELVSGEEESDDKGSDDGDFASANDDFQGSTPTKKGSRSPKNKLQKRNTIVVQGTQSGSAIIKKKSKRLSAPTPDKRAVTRNMSVPATLTQNPPPSVAPQLQHHSSAPPALQHIKREPTPGMAPKELLLLGGTIWGVVFLVSFLGTLVLPGFHWSAKGWIISSMYIATVSTIVRLLLHRWAPPLANILINSLGGKISHKTDVIGDAVLPVLVLIVCHAAFLYGISLLLADNFHIAGWRSLIVHTAVTSLTSYLTGYIEAPPTKQETKSD